MNQHNLTANRSLQVFVQDDVIRLIRGSDVIALMSPEDTDLTSFFWVVNDSGYAVRQIKRNGKYAWERMHRVILSRILQRDLKATEYVDHKNGITTDNRRGNLRLATPMQNCQNRRKNRNNQGFKGVRFHKIIQKWESMINSPNRRISIGYFLTSVAAAYAYDRAALFIHGDFAKTNFPKEIYVGLPPYKETDYRRKTVSKYRGVSWNSKRQYWLALAYFEGSSHFLGTFKTEIEAAHAYDAAIMQYGLSVKRLNFPIKQDWNDES